MPLSVSKDESTLIETFSNSISTSSTPRRFHIRPAVCHVVPEVNFDFSKSTVLIPRFAK